jgi:HK97 gp10 family phage protein
MAGLTFKLTGFDLSGLKQYAEDVQAAVKDEIKATAYNIEAEAKDAAPVDLGNLRANIGVTVNGNNISATSGAEYSAYVEWGTGTFVNVDPMISSGSLENYYESLEELRAYAIQFKGKGIRQVNLPPRPFFFPAVFRNYGKMLESIKEILKEGK